MWICGRGGSVRGLQTRGQPPVPQATAAPARPAPPRCRRGRNGGGRPGFPPRLAPCPRPPRPRPAPKTSAGRSPTSTPPRPTLDADLVAAEAEADDLAGRLRGRVADLGAAALAAALAELGGVHDRAGRAYTYAYLAWSTDTEDPARGALLQRVREAYTRVGQALVFFDVEWAAVEPDRARALLERDELAPYRHHLELKTEAPRPRPLRARGEGPRREGGDGVERVEPVFRRDARAPPGSPSAARASRSSRRTVKLYDADRRVRRDAAEAVTEGLVELERPLTFVFNTVLADAASSDRLRGLRLVDREPERVERDLGRVRRRARRGRHGGATVWSPGSTGSSAGCSASTGSTTTTATRRPARPTGS